MQHLQVPEFDIIPTGRGLRIECWHPATMCSMAYMKNMRGLNYNELIHDTGDRKTIIIEPWKCCDYRMAQGLYFIASNICNACRMQEQTSR